MVTRVIVNGAKGKMGALACQTLNNHPEFDLVAQLSKEDNLAQAIKETRAQIVVDLTRADCVYANSLTIINEGAYPVIGTSGLMDEQIKELAALCERRQKGGIIEAHHQQKLDAPSGTALKTAEMIAKARKNPKNVLSLKELLPGARGGSHHEINIHSLRLPGVLARQEVLFGNVGETLSITHNSIDRQCFMPGIVLACQKVMSLNTLIYGLEHLL